MPSTQGFPSCAKSGLGGQVLPHLGVPKGNMPHWGQSLHQCSCPLPGSRHHACSTARKLASVPPTPRTQHTHTHFRAAWTKESVLLSSLSALLGTCLSPPPPPLPCLSSASHQGHHTHTHIYTHGHMRSHTCSHMLTHIRVAPHRAKHSYPCSLMDRDTSTFRETSSLVHVHIHTQRDWDGEGLMASRDEAQRARHMGSI